MYTLVATICIALLWVECSAKVVVRVRLVTGTLQRIEVDEDESVENMFARVRQMGGMSEIGQLCFRSRMLTEDSDESVASLSPKNGEIFDVFEPKLDTCSESNKAQTGPEERGMKRAAPSGRKKKTITMEDLGKERQGMTKITRQMGLEGDEVLFSASTGRILQRVRTGGVALLIGEVNSARPSMSSSSGAAPSKQTVISQRNVRVQVAAMCEILGPDESFPSGKRLSSLSTVKAARAAASGLGQRIVGLCIGPRDLGTFCTFPPDSDRGNAQMSRAVSPWTAGHVLAALELGGPAGVMQGEIGSWVVVTAAPAPAFSAEGSVRGSAFFAGGPAGKSKQKLKDGEDAGLSLEAFRLTDQCRTLLEQGVFPDPYQADSSDSTEKEGVTQDKKKRTASATGTATRRKHVLVDSDGSIVLQKKVLVKNAETLCVDPLLLAVPMPIKALHARESRSLSGAAQRQFGADGIEHSFPTPAELAVGIASDQAVVGDRPNNKRPVPGASTSSTVARRHLVALLGANGRGLPPLPGLGASSEDAKAEQRLRRLQDPHLLMHLRLAGLLDARSVSQLAGLLGMGYSSKVASAAHVAQAGAALESVRLLLGAEDDFFEEE
jgi:hypothetical protein